MERARPSPHVGGWSLSISVQDPQNIYRWDAIRLRSGRVFEMRGVGMSSLAIQPRYPPQEYLALETGGLWTPFNGTGALEFGCGVLNI